MQEDYKRLKRRILKLVKLFLRFVSLNNEKAKTKEKRQVHVIRKAERRASQIEYLLNNLGFTERAPVELHNILSSKIEADQKRPFARVLASWYANQRNDVDAIKCMKIIDYAVDGEKKQEHLNEAAIMKAECYEVLGERRTGKKIILKTLKEGHDAAIYFVAMNFEDLILDRLKWINKAFSFYNFTDITFDPSYGSTPFDCLRFGNLQRPQKTKSLSLKPKVTVIMAVYNAENTIKTALDSLIAQTWSNLEILIVDDCSTDGTVNLVEEYCNMDNRLRLIIGRENCGPYVARNLAFSEATGEFVTCHDADDWSHPQKIEIQVLHLLQNAEVIGNTSQHIRVTPDLKVYRRGKFGSIILNNISSFMFRRDSIINNIGYWDCVRFRADDEFIRRIRQIFGNTSVINIPTGPLSFLRQHDKSLTGDKYFGMHGYLMGARKHYVDIQKHYHKKTNNLFYEFPMLSRPFPAPEPMWPKREVAGSRRRHFDIIIASDFRLTGGNISAIEEEVEVQKQMKLRTGLFQLSRYDLRQNLKKTNPKILDLLDGDLVQMIVYGEKVECDCLIVRHPPVLQERQKFIPDVEAENINIIIDQAPYDSYEPKGLLLYDIKRCQSILHECFRKNGMWYPIDPLIREALLRHHAEEINYIDLSEEDWPGISNISK